MKSLLCQEKPACPPNALPVLLQRGGFVYMDWLFFDRHNSWRFHPKHLKRLANRFSHELL